MAIEITPKMMTKLIESWCYWYEKSGENDATAYHVTPNRAIAKRMDQAYWCKDGDRFVGCDNTDFCCWVEDFGDKQTCIDWIEGKCDSEGNYYEV